MQADDDQLGERGLDLVGRQLEQRQHQALAQHLLEGRLQLGRLREQPQLEQRRHAVDQADGGGVARLLLLFEYGDHLVEAGRADRVDRHPFLRIDAVLLEGFLHGVAQQGGLPVAQAENALQDAGDGEDVLDRLRLAVIGRAREERIERDAVAAHIMHA
jgi:hypothetical protein